MREHIYKKKEVNGNRGKIEKYTKVDAELGLWGGGVTVGLFVTERGKKQNIE
jgi:hypothetical protein